jgi:ribosomal protein L7/L12
MSTNSSPPSLRALYAEQVRPQRVGRAVAWLLAALACSGFVYLLLWFADAFPILPGPPVLDPWPRLLLSLIVGVLLIVVAAIITSRQKEGLLRQAEQLAQSGEQLRAVRVLHQATGLKLEACVRMVETTAVIRPASPAPLTLPEEVKHLAAAGQQLRAVERLRELTGASLPEALRQVEQHLGIRPLWQELADAPLQKIDAIQAYRQEHGAGLAEAKAAVEEYLKSRESPT